MAGRGHAKPEEGLLDTSLVEPARRALDSNSREPESRCKAPVSPCVDLSAAHCLRGRECESRRRRRRRCPASRASGLIRKSTETRTGRRLADRETLIGSSLRTLRRRHGVQLRKWAVDAAGSTLSFADGTQLAVGSVVWATGFRVDHSFIDVPVFNADERLVSRQGVTASPVSTSSG
jgi:hypothetical protein